jgi:predicted ATPase
LSLKGLIDSERELEALVAPMDAALAGSGQVVLIEGPAGIGKTRLLAAAREVAAERGLQALLARGSEMS